MLRTAVCKHVALGRLLAEPVPILRAFSLSAAACAPKGRKPLVRAPKTKAKVKVKVNHNKKEKVKRSGITPHEFKDAVRTLRFESYARDLSDLNIPVLSAGRLQQLKDTVVGYEPKMEEMIKLMGGFKKYQHHELFRKHYSLVSDNTVEVHRTFVAQLDGTSAKNRMCFLGPKGVGKSTLISQAQALACSQHGDAVLLHIAEPELFIKGYSDYVYNPTLKLYHQPMFTKRWIKKIRVVNEEVFRKMPLLRDVSFSNKKGAFNYKKGENNLHEYLVNCHDFGVFGATGAFLFFMEHVVAYSKDFPVLFSVDNINALFETPFTKYFHKDMSPIHFSEFELGNLIHRLMSGDLVFSKGGVLLAETSDLGASRTLRVGLQLEDLDPYATNINHDVASSIMRNGGVTTLPLANLNKDQAKKLMEFWDDSGMLHIRDYPTKPVYKRPEDVEEDEKRYRVGEFVTEMDRAATYEKKLQKTYFVSGGNPGVFLKNIFLAH